MGIVNLDTFDETKLKLGKSGRAIKLFYDKEPIQICSSTLYTPFGVKSITKEWSNYSEYNIDCALNQSASETSVNFRKNIEKFDSILHNLVKENTSLFSSKNEQCNENFIYSPILKENGNYPKLIKLQLSRDNNGNFNSFIFNENKEKVKITEENIEEILSKGKTFKVIMECVKVWFYNGKVGSIWKIVQLKFSERNYEKINNVNSEENVKNVYNQLLILDD